MAGKNFFTLITHFPAQTAPLFAALRDQRRAADALDLAGTDFGLRALADGMPQFGARVLYRAADRLAVTGHARYREQHQQYR